MRKTIAGLLCLMLAPAPALASINETTSLLNAIPTIRDIHSFLESNPSPGVEVNLEIVVPQGMSRAEISGDCNDDGYQLSLGLAYSNTWNMTFKYDSEPAGDEDKATWVWLDNPLFCGFMRVSKETIVNLYGGEYGFYIKDFRVDEFGGTFNVRDMGSLKLINGEIWGSEARLGGGTIFATDESHVSLKNAYIGESLSGANGGAVQLGGMASLKSKYTYYTNNLAEASGAVLYADGNTTTYWYYGGADDNNAGANGGVIAGAGSAHFSMNFGEAARNFAGGSGSVFSINELATLDVWYSSFSMNDALGFGDFAYIDTAAEGKYGVAGMLMGVQVQSPVPSFNQGLGVSLENPRGKMWIGYSTMWVEDSSGSGGSNAVGEVNSTHNIWFNPRISFRQAKSSLQASGPGKVGTEANCNDFGTGAFISRGYNISSDNSCGLTQPTDLPNTDPALTQRVDGALEPAMNSPALDSGATDVNTVDGFELASLPCGYRDPSGTARPQDGNGDGVFECDRGAIEVPGIGAIEPGHSAAYFNLDRDGEGIFVEVLDENTAVVYAFSYKPDGSGASWFIGVCTIKGNGIVCDDLLYPTGARFGEAFDTADIELKSAGGMSVVLPDCAAAAPGGNVAFSGHRDLGFEGLITRATRLTKVTGCGTMTPSEKAGLSGAYFDTDRNGEGIVVQWLDNGTVLVVFWTYTPDGEQIWMIGIGTPDGNMVTMDALYPVGFTSWGRGFDASEVVLEKWGTFKLTWTTCGDADASAPASAKVTFETTAMAPGYTSATRNYDRLTGLAGTTCPAL